MRFVRLGVIAAFVILAFQRPAASADISVDQALSIGTKLVTIRITGEIKSGDDLVFARIAKGAKGADERGRSCQIARAVRV
jgi:hypothetical protein